MPKLCVYLCAWFLPPSHPHLLHVFERDIPALRRSTAGVARVPWHLWLVVGKAALPEVVFVGRSNVGKSSLVNMLVNRKALAPTSAVPGFTQVRTVHHVDAVQDLQQYQVAIARGLFGSLCLSYI